MDHLRSFAWGLAPSSARAQVVMAQVGEGCTVSDSDWTRSIHDLRMRASEHHPSIVESCSVRVKASLVPKLLLRELLVLTARRLLRHHDAILTAPRVTVHTCVTTPEVPPVHWHLSLTACFPCDGTPTTRCLGMDVILDARHVDRSHVLSAWDAGVVPAEQSISDGVAPFNAQTGEMA